MAGRGRGIRRRGGDGRHTLPAGPGPGDGPDREPVDGDDAEAPTRPRGSPAISRRFVVVVTVVFLGACTAPYVLAWTSTPQDRTFSGILLNNYDQYYYLAAQRSRAELLEERNRFTTEPGTPAPGPPIYPLLGELQRRTGLPTLAAYHLPRVAAAAAFPALVAWLFGLCFPGRREVVAWGVVLTLFVTGVLTTAPWVPGSGRSSEWVVGTSPLRSFAVFPHFAVAYAGLVLCYGSVAMAAGRGRSGTVAAVAATGGLLVGVSHTFLMLPVLLVAGAAGVIMLAQGRGHRRPAALSLLAAGGALGGALPFIIELRRDQALFDARNGVEFPRLFSGPFLGWIYAFGVVSVLAVLGLAVLVRGRERSPGVLLLAGIAGTHLALMYLPVTAFQRRYSEGLILGLGGLASVGLWSVGRRVPTVLPLHWLTVGAVVVAGTAVAVRDLGGSGEHLSDDVVDLSAIVTEGDVVLSGNRIGYRLPGRSDGMVFAARSVGTVRYAVKHTRRSLYADAPDRPSSLAWLRRTGITMVVADAEDPTFEPVGLDRPGTCLAPAFERPGLTAYRVSASCIDTRLAVPGP